MAKRLQAMGTSGYENGFKLTILRNRLEEPLRRKKPTVCFVNSMSDLFHKQIADSYIDAVFDLWIVEALLNVHLVPIDRAVAAQDAMRRDGSRLPREDVQAQIRRWQEMIRSRNEWPKFMSCRSKAKQLTPIGLGHITARIGGGTDLSCSKPLV